jgi:threonine/homoserine/homoserine lactone efflux protein
VSFPVDPARLWAYVALVAVLVVVPGPANLFAIANGARRGRAAVLAAAVGMNTGSLVWFAGAAAGLGALVIAFPQLFRVLAFAGAAYVAWLGIQSILAARRPPPEAKTIPLRKGAFRDGLAVQLSNPKAMLFITAILPPFLAPDRPLAPQVAVYAAVGVTFDMAAMTAYGLGGAALAERMTEPRFRSAFDLFVGVLLIVTAILILLRR